MKLVEIKRSVSNRQRVCVEKLKRKRKKEKEINAPAQKGYNWLRLSTELPGLE